MTETLPEGYASYDVDVTLYEAIDLDLEGFLDVIAERAGHPLLMDVNYAVKGCTDETLHLTVTGDTSMDDEDAPGGEDR